MVIKTAQIGCELSIGGTAESTWLAEVASLVLRVFTGLALALAHGLGKLPPPEPFVQGVAEMGFPLPGFFAWSAGLSEFAGGLLLALGLATRPASLFIVFTMAVAAFVAHADDPFLGKERALLFLVIALMFMLKGAGRLSVDAGLRTLCLRQPPGFSVSR
jgi:putative oxidoreductase